MILTTSSYRSLPVLVVWGFYWLSFLAILFVSRRMLLATEPAASLRLHEVQLIGTHNSYHVAPDAVAASLIRSVVPQEADAFAYSHKSLTDQLEDLGVRQLELDLFLDPRGGLYSRPLGQRLAEKQLAKITPHDPEGKLKQPGFKILHSPDFDFRTTVYSLADALGEVRKWSDSHRRHFPVFLLMELKSESFSPLTRPPAWDYAACLELEKEVLKAIPRERILTPDDVRGSRQTLRDSVAGSGWPTIDSARGKVVLLLDNEGGIRDEYLKGSETLAGRLMFVSVARSHPAAAWMKRNDPMQSYEDIQSLVQAGFLVRTRADSGTIQARKNDVAQRDKAFASGAQIISTDFPQSDPRFKDYEVNFGKDVFVRPNSVSAPRASRALRITP